MLKIKGVKGYNREMQMIKFFLQNARALEKFMLDIPNQANNTMLTRHVHAIQKLFQAFPVKPEINIY